MITLSYKEGKNKNGKDYMLATIEFVGKDGKTCRERFFVKPWNFASFAEAINANQAIENAVKDVYGQ